MDPLRCSGARGAALANQAEALVAAEAQGAAQLGPCQAVHCAILRVVGGAAVGRWGGKHETTQGENACKPADEQRERDDDNRK